MARKPSPDDLRKLKEKAAEAAAKGRFEKAAELYREAAEGDPRDVATRQKLADTLRRAGRFPDAIETYRDVADRFAKDGLLIKAIAISKTILELDPEHVETQQALAALYAARAQAEGARPPARTLVVEAMKTAGAQPAPRPPTRDPEESVVSLALGSSAPPPRQPPAAPPARPDTLEISITTSDFEIPAVAAPPPAATATPAPRLAATPPPVRPQPGGTPPPGWAATQRPRHAATPPPIAGGTPPPVPAATPPPVAAATPPPRRPAAVEAPLAVPPGDEPILVPVEELSPPELAAAAAPPAHAQPAFEAPAPPRPPQVVARHPTAFAQIVRAAEIAVEAGIEEDLLIRADPEDAVVEEEPLAAEPGGAPAEAPAEEGIELVVQPEPEATPPPPAVAAPPVAAAAPPPRAAPPAPPAPTAPPAAPAAPAAPALPRIPIFSDVSRDAFVALTAGMVLHRVAPGESVIQEGDEGTSFYVVASGRLLVSKHDDAAPDRKLLLARLGDGDFFGEMALLSGAPRSATVTAELESEILEFRAESLLDLAGRHPHVAQSLRRFYRQRLLANALAVSPIFRPFPRGERKLLMERFRAREVVEGEVVIQEGQRSDGLYVVLEGAVDVVKSADGHAVVVSQLREGDLFGEMSCLRKAPASATIVVRRPGTLLRLPRTEFDELVVTYPQILELVATLSEERAESLDAILSGHASWTDEGLVLT